MYNEILEKVIVILSGISEADEITEDSELLDDLDIDSMNLLVLLSSMEEEFKVHISEDDMRKMYTVGDVAEIILNLINE